MSDVYNSMTMYCQNESDTRILSDYILSEATRVELHFIGEYLDCVIEGYMEFNSTHRTLSYNFHAKKNSISKWCQMFEKEIDQNSVDICNISFEEFIDLVKLFNNVGIGNLFYFVEYF